MQTVTFTCGHCGKPMGVSAEWLGQQVRCPHCTQVVQAAAPVPVSPPASEDAVTSFAPRGDDGPESIFGPPQVSGEDVLGGGEVPRVEMPAEPQWPASVLDRATPPPVSAAEPEPEPEPPSLPPLVRTPVHRRSRLGGLVTALLIVPLISYSILATIAILILRRQPEKPHPLEMLPDIEGDRPGATHRGKKQALRYRVTSPDTTPVPAKLQVGLGETLAVGDLEVTPTRVERRRIAVQVGPFKPDPQPEPCLALELHLRNRSADVAFAPLDRFFTRRWRRKSAGERAMPFTILEMGDRRYYGGPTEWQPRVTGRFAEHAEVVVGQNLDRVLEPGEETTTFVCTDPEVAEGEMGAAAALEAYKGPLLWRVQVRRGLVRWTTAKGEEREDPVTAVVGVVFRAEDVAAE